MTEMKWNPNTNKFEPVEKPSSYIPTKETIELTELTEPVKKETTSSLENIRKKIMDYQQRIRKEEIEKIEKRGEEIKTDVEKQRQYENEWKRREKEAEFKRQLVLDIKKVRQKVLRQEILRQQKRMMMEQLKNKRQQYSQPQYRQPVPVPRKTSKKKSKKQNIQPRYFIPPHQHRPNPLTGVCMICGVKERRIL